MGAPFEAMLRPFPWGQFCGWESTGRVLWMRVGWKSGSKLVKLFLKKNLK